MYFCVQDAGAMVGEGDIGIVDSAPYEQKVSSLGMQRSMSVCSTDDFLWARVFLGRWRGTSVAQGHGALTLLISSAVNNGRLSTSAPCKGVSYNTGGCRPGPDVVANLAA